MAIFTTHRELLYVIGFLNSKLSQVYLEIFNEGLNYNQGDVAKVPIIEMNVSEVNGFVCNLIDEAKEDWDDFEESWNFKKHPLV